jgi:hypothetical protein
MTDETNADGSDGKWDPEHFDSLAAQKALYARFGERGRCFGTGQPLSGGSPTVEVVAAGGTSGKWNPEYFESLEAQTAFFERVGERGRCFRPMARKTMDREWSEQTIFGPARAGRIE